MDVKLEFEKQKMERLVKSIDAQTLVDHANDAYQRSLLMIAGLSEDQLMGPKHSNLNPLRWEIAHASYFYEFWILRNHFKKDPYIEDIDQLFDSIEILHDDRWDLPLPTMEFTYAYMQYVHESTLRYLQEYNQDAKLHYLTQYSIYHQDMHCEAFAYERQTLGYPAPDIKPDVAAVGVTVEQTVEGDIHIPGGSFFLGAVQKSEFVFDNEKWGHKHKVLPFDIARTAVSNEEYLEFVQSDGYRDPSYWCSQGWGWRSERELHHPVYWRQHGSSQKPWQVRRFNQWTVLSPLEPVMNISWYEANAYCRWANRRLPSELEWEVAASAMPSEACGLGIKKNKYPWGEQLISAEYANLDGNLLGPVNVNAFSRGDSAFGCRQMLGNVWEWTSTTFQPYPGFLPDMYEEYSQPLFGHTKVLRGGSWVTRARVIRNTYRNYYSPDRNDIFAGFRTCALSVDNNQKDFVNE